jgi:antitoxin MazE
MKSALSKWGNSLAVRLPKAAVEKLGLREGAELDLVVANGRIELIPTERSYEDYLEALRAAVASGITPSQDEAWEDSPPRADEVW